MHVRLPCRSRFADHLRPQPGRTLTRVECLQHGNLECLMTMVFL